MAARMPSRWARGVRARRTKGQAGAGGPGRPGVEVGGRGAGVGQVVSSRRSSLSRKGAVEALVGLSDLVPGGELVDVLALGRLEQ